MSEQPAYQAFDPELVSVACHLAGCQPEDIMAVAQRDDALVAIVQPGAKYVFTAQQVADAVKALHTPLHLGHGAKSNAPAAEHDAPPKRRKA